MATDGSPLPSLDAAPLQFDATTSAPAAPQPMSCHTCAQPIQSVYYESAGQVLCARCRGKLEVSGGAAGKGGRFLRASGLGLGAALVGAVIYYAITAATGRSIGLVAILVGFLVGKAVFIGSGNRGGRAYQLLAVTLTYFAIALTYVPYARDAFKEKMGEKTAVHADSASAAPTDVAPADSLAASAATPTTPATPATSSTAAPITTTVKATRLGVGAILLLLGFVVLFSLALPIIAGFSAPITLLITGFGLMQAWRMNRKIDLLVSGPYRLASPTPDAAA